MLPITALRPISHAFSIAINSGRVGRMVSNTQITTRRKVATLPRTPLFEALHKHDRNSLAVVHSDTQKSFTYGSLIDDVVAAKSRLAGHSNGNATETLQGERIAFLIENGYDYVVQLLAILASNAIALPLAPSFPPSELRYNINHAQPRLLVASSQYENQARQVLEDGLDTVPALVQSRPEELGNDNAPTGQEYQLEDIVTPLGGLMLYTSGTTSRPVRIRN